MSIIDTIKKFFVFIGCILKGDSPKATLEPSELTKAVLDTANENSKDWDDQLDLPNAFEVRIPRDEWDSYYGSRVALTERRLEQSLSKFASEIGACMEKPTVTIIADGALPSGKVRVSASFSTPSEMPGTPVIANCVTDGELAGGAGWACTPVPSTTSALSDASGAADPSITPHVAKPTALVCVPGGRSFKVLEGSTIGIVRDPSRACPVIGLPYAESLKTCSQIQGRFVKSDGAWAFVDEGRNGTHVLRGATMTQVEDLPFVLEDDDMLFFGASETPAVTFHTKVL